MSSPARAPQQRRSRFAAERPGAGAGRRRGKGRRAGLSRRRRHHQGAQYRDRAPAGRRQAAQRRLQGRPGRQEGRRAGAHRSDHLSGAARPGDRQEGAGRGAARQRQDRSRRATSGSPPPTPSTSSRPTPSGRWSRNTQRSCNPTRRRSKTRRRRSATPPSSRRSTGAPASAWSTKAISCTPPTPTGIVVITQIKPISVLFNLPQQDLGQVNAAFAKGPLAVDAQRSDNNAVIDRGTLRVVDNQVDQTDRHGEAQGRVSQCRPAALAGPVRQCAAADRHAASRWW